MPGVSAEQIAWAREIDLLSYLQSREPHELKPDGPGRYTTVTHSSLVISNGKWNWNHGGVGGVSALDYLIKVRGIGFVDAVDTLCGEMSTSYSPIIPRAQPPLEKRLFAPPKPEKFASNAAAYLQDRGINADIVGKCLQTGIVYESRFYCAPVVVFAGKDDTGKTRFAAMRGIGTDMKRDAAGSDKRYNFRLPPTSGNDNQLAIFESPIDLISHVSMAQRGELAFDGHRLSLGGTSSVALIAFLERNPQIERITLCLDNDAAGQTATKKIQAMLAADEHFSHIKTIIQLPCSGKDYNDVLLHAIQLEREHNPHCRPNKGAAHFL